MTRYLTQSEILQLHSLLIQQSEGLNGIRDQGSLESAIAQPQMTFGGENLYPKYYRKSECIRIFYNYESPLYRW